MSKIPSFALIALSLLPQAFSQSPAAPPAPADAVRVAAGTTSLVQRVAPVYPPIARQARVQGVVKLRVVVGTDGAVQQLDVIEGPAMLRNSALDAVRQWIYAPVVIDGKPARIVTDVDISFYLQ
jgi:protein TonB